MKLFNKSRDKRFLTSLYHAELCTSEKCFCTYREEIRSLFPIREERTLHIPPQTASEELPDEILKLRAVQIAMSGKHPILVQVGETAAVERLGIPTERLSTPVKQPEQLEELKVVEKPWRSSKKRR